MVMKQADTSHNLLSSLFIDFRAEVIAAEMIENGTAEDRILILMLGAFKRPFSKDVRAVEEELSEYDHKEYFLVKTPREGIYDMLPEGLFHAPTPHKSIKTEKEVIQQMKQRRKEEQDARKFFLPFEATINFLRMQIALYENRLDKRSHYNELVNIFSGQWEIFTYLDARQANIFLHLIPIMHDIRDDHPVIEKIIELMFLIPVSISLRSQMPLHPEDTFMSNLGEGVLGVNLTTGNELFDEGVDELLVTIGPVENETFKSFMAGSRNDKILQLLYDYLLPVHVDVFTEFNLVQTERMTRISDEAEDRNAFLGEDTFL